MKYLIFMEIFRIGSKFRHKLCSIIILSNVKPPVLDRVVFQHSFKPKNFYDPKISMPEQIIVRH